MITLVIIGVIAAITVPTFITKYQKEQTVSKLKAAYSIFSQAVRASVAQNGRIASWDIWTDTTTGNIIRTYSSNAIKKYINPYLSGVKQISGYSTYTLHSNKPGILFWSSSNVYTINNGMTYSMYLYDTSYYGEAYIVVDLNGPRNPNRLGRDVFVFTLDKNKNELVLYGSGMSRGRLLSSASGCTKIDKAEGSGQYQGMTCGALIACDGWKIADDYPW